MTLFGVTSCGATDELGGAVPPEDPNKMSGNWFYYVVDTSSAVDDTICVIINNGADKQTADIEGVPKTGKVAYLWNGDKVVPPVSARGDCPNHDEDGKLAVYIYVADSIAAVNCYAWNKSDENKLCGGWPGKTMQKEGGPSVVTTAMTITSIDVVGLPTDISNGTELFLTGEPFDWGKPGEAIGLFKGTTDGTSKMSITGISQEFSGEAAPGEAPTVELKFAAAAWAKPEIDGEKNGDGTGAENAKLEIVEGADKIVVLVKEVIGSGDSSVCVCDWKAVKASETAICEGVSVTGLPSSDSSTVYLTGDDFGWTEPGDASLLSGAMSSGTLTIEKPFILRKGKGFKFAATGWTKPEICVANDGGAEGANVTVDPSWLGNTGTLTGTYSSTITITGKDKPAENGNVYVCTWALN